MRISDWSSDVCSSDLENELMGHPKIAEAAVIGVPHPKWAERPLACVVVAPGEELTKDEVLEFLDGRVAKWWLPDDVAFVDEIPKTSVGKFSKKDLRQKFDGYELPTTCSQLTRARVWRPMASHSLVGTHSTFTTALPVKPPPGS